jgi:uncharacterized membrane protein
MAGLRSFVENALTGFLVVPGGIAIVFLVLALGMIGIDETVEEAQLAFAGDAEAGRDILTAIATSLATVVGVVFSITLITLQLVSSQYGPRILRTFLNDRISQVTAGFFVGTFGYCLVVLRVTRSVADGDDAFVPGLSITLAIVLGLLAFALLLLFINHIAKSIEVSSIAARLAGVTRGAVDRQYPEPYGEPAGEQAPLVETWQELGDGKTVTAGSLGFVRVVDLEAIGRVSSKRDLRIAVAVQPGDFVTDLSRIATVWPIRGGWDGDADPIRSAIKVGSTRDVQEDALFGIRQIADIGIRALSPSLNDPTTGVLCIRYLGAILQQLAERRFPADARTVAGGTVIAVRAPEFRTYVDEAVAELAHAASREPLVLVTLLEMLASVIRSVHPDEKRAGAIAEAARIAAERGLVRAEVESDRGAIIEARERVLLAARLAAGDRRPDPDRQPDVDRRADGRDRDDGDDGDDEETSPADADATVNTSPRPS